MGLKLVDGERTHHHDCEDCGFEVWRTWHDVNGGYWTHDTHSCISHLRSMIGELAEKIEQLTRDL
jgi:hypothetical protein